MLGFCIGEIYDQARLIPIVLAGHTRNPERSLPRQLPGRHLIEPDFPILLRLVHQPKQIR